MLNKTHKTHMKEIKDLRDILCLWILIFNIIKMVIHAFIKLWKYIFVDILILKFVWKGKETRIAKAFGKKKNKIGGISYPISRPNIYLQ